MTRIDQLLVQRGLASTRAQAQRLIKDGVQWRQGAVWQQVSKNGAQVPAAAELQLLDERQMRYVSRGGLKLEAALHHTGLIATGARCLDVGQSSGGFSDCLLQHGAAHVTGIDVGQGQLHPKLRANPRVRCLEGINARRLQAADLSNTASAHQLADQLEAAPFDIIVVDLSFISQTLVLPALLPWLKSSGVLLSLVKPQFELQPSQIGKGGIVKDDALYALVKERLRTCCAALDLSVTHWFDSNLPGGDGNHEFFLCARPDRTIHPTNQTP